MTKARQLVKLPDPDPEVENEWPEPEEWSFEPDQPWVGFLICVASTTIVIGCMIGVLLWVL